jgi:hypothetical protein
MVARKPSFKKVSEGFKGHGEAFEAHLQQTPNEAAKDVQDRRAI